jgi:hypothetical protein
MRIVAIVLGVLGSLSLFVGVLVVFLGAGAAGIAVELGDASAKEMGQQLVLMGIVGWIASVVALIGACLSVAKPRFASLTMTIALIVGALATGLFSIPGVILLAIASLFAFLGRNEGGRRETS